MQQQLKPSIIQPPRNREFLQKLTWLHSESTPWIIGLPITIDPLSVTPPCYIYFQPQMATVDMFEGRIRVSPYPELDASSVIQFLDQLELEPIHKVTGVPKKVIAIRATQAIMAIRDIMEADRQVRSS